MLILLVAPVVGLSGFNLGTLNCCCCCGSSVCMSSLFEVDMSGIEVEPVVVALAFPLARDEAEREDEGRAGDMADMLKPLAPGSIECRRAARSAAVAAEGC
jgi:hypothetical protein